MSVPNGWNESDVEDWICENPAVVWDQEDVRLIGRQVVLPSGGRLDVLLMSRDHDGGLRIIVVEVKRDRVKVDALDQLLNYMYEIERVFYSGVRVCGVLCGADYDDSVPRIVKAIPGVYLATYWAELAFDPGWSQAVEDYWERGRPGGVATAEYRLARCTQVGGKFVDDITPLVATALREIRATRNRRLPARLAECPPPSERRLRAV